MSATDAAHARQGLLDAVAQLERLAGGSRIDLEQIDDSAAVHPDYPDRVGSQLLDAAQTVERTAREYRAELLAIRRAT